MPKYNVDFNSRLEKYQEGLGSMLKYVWYNLERINLDNPELGSDQVYTYCYSNPHKIRINYEKKPVGDLDRYIKLLLANTKGSPVYPQCHPKYDKLPLELVDPLPYSEELNDTLMREYWKTFFFVENPNYKGPNLVQKRIYVNAPVWRASLEIFKFIIEEFKRNGNLKGVKEAKVVGPGPSFRKDKIVVYCLGEADRNFMLDKLKEFGKSHPGHFKNPLPPMVKTKAIGIGIADEPPEFEIMNDGNSAYSFGSFYSTLIWIALKRVPESRTSRVNGKLERISNNYGREPEHMLDNFDNLLSKLKLNPLKPHKIPAWNQIEPLYDTESDYPGADYPTPSPKRSKLLGSLANSIKSVVTRYRESFGLLRIKSEQSMRALKYLEEIFPYEIETAKWNPNENKWVNFPQEVIRSLLGRDDSYSLNDLRGMFPKGKITESQEGGLVLRNFTSLQGLTPLKQPSKMYSILSEEYVKWKGLNRDILG